MGWITSKANFPTDYDKVKDLAKFKELVFLNKFDTVVPVLLAAGLFGLGNYLESAYPVLEVTGVQLLVWGFFISTTFLFHGTARSIRFPMYLADGDLKPRIRPRTTSCWP